MDIQKTRTQIKHLMLDTGYNQKILAEKLKVPYLKFNQALNSRSGKAHLNVLNKTLSYLKEAVKPKPLH